VEELTYESESCGERIQSGIGLHVDFLIVRAIIDMRVMRDFHVRECVLDLTLFSPGDAHKTQSEAE
jgi:hypothetical protein